MKKIQQKVSNKISNMNFILAFFIVLIHSSCMNSLKADNSFYSINYVIQKSFLIISDSAVPLFFSMSMFLLFSDYRINNYGSLVKKKIRTILLPYLLWGIFGWTVYASLTHIPMLSNLVQAETVSFNPWDILRTIFLAEYDPPLWFLRVLFILVIISPVIYLVIAKFNKIVLSLFLVTITVLLSFFNFGYSRAIFWLPICIIAAWFGYYKSKDYKLSSKKISIISWLLLVGFIALIISLDIKEESPIFYFYRMLSPFLLWNAIELVPNISNRKLNPKLNFSFFSFCAHIYFVIVFKKIFMVLLGKSNFGITLTFFATAIASFFACFIVSLLLRKVIPKIYSFISGNR